MEKSSVDIMLRDRDREDGCSAVGHVFMSFTIYLRCYIDVRCLSQKTCNKKGLHRRLDSSSQENNLYHVFWRELFLFLHCDFKLIYTTASLAIVQQTAGGQFMADKLPGKC